MPSFLHLSEGVLPWFPLFFSTNEFLLLWHGGASCSRGHGPAPPPCPQRHRSPHPHSASVRPNPLRGSPPSRTAPPVRTALTLAPRMPAPAYGTQAGATTSGRHLDALLPQPGLCLARLGGLGQSPRPWPSPWRSLAAAAVSRLSRLLSGDPGYALSRHARLRRPHRARHRVPGRGLRYPGHRASLRGRPHHRPAMVSGSGRAAPGVFPPRPARWTRGASPAR